MVLRGTICFKDVPPKLKDHEDVHRQVKNRSVERIAQIKGADI